MPAPWVVPTLYALCCLIWGSTWLVIKIGLVGVPPFLGAGLRFLVAAATLLALIAARKTPLRLRRGDKIAILSSGLGSFTFSYACVYWAEQYISSGLTAVLYCTMPLIVALLSSFWSRAETLNARKIGGILVAMAGTVVLFWPAQQISEAQIAGMAATLASAFFAAANLVIVKKYGKETDIFVLNGLAMALGAACLLSMSALTEPYHALEWSRANVLAIIYLALVGSVAAFLSFFYLVKIMDATKLSLITLIFPMVAVALGWAFLGEAVTLATGAGMAVVLAGVAIALLPARLTRAR